MPSSARVRVLEIKQQQTKCVAEQVLGMSNPRGITKKSGSGILTGGRSLLTGRQFLSSNSHSIDKKDNEGSRTPSFIQKSESEDNSELMQYLSQVNTKSKKTRKAINWDIVDDLGDTTQTLSDDEDLPERIEYFLKPKKPIISTEKDRNENRVSNTVDPHQDSDTANYIETDANSTEYSETDKKDSTSEVSSLPLKHGPLKEHIFSLDELEVDSSMIQSIEESGIKSHMIGSVSDDNSMLQTSYSVDKISEEKENQKYSAYDSDVHTSLTVSEDLKSNETSSKLTETNGEDIYSDKFEEITTKESSTFSRNTIEDAMKESTQSSSIEESFNWNVISELPSLDDNEKSDSLAVTSMDYTMDFDSSENQSTGSESTLCNQSGSPKLSHKQKTVTDSCTQTFLGGDNLLGLHSGGTPTVSQGPPMFSTNYHDPPPVVLPADTLEVLTAYSPNMVALNDILRSQLTLTRQLLDTNRALLTSLTSSLKPDYQYTTLEDTRQYIHNHRPKILTLSEATKRTRHKQT